MLINTYNMVDITVAIRTRKDYKVNLNSYNND